MEQNIIFDQLQAKYNELLNRSYFASLSFDERMQMVASLKEELIASGQYPYRRPMDDFILPVAKREKAHMRVNLASNDYLSFSNHPAIVKACTQYAENYSTGAGSVPMLAGTYCIHKELENKIARFTAYEDAILYSSGYAANMGVLTALLTPADAVVLDMQVHASILDGSRHAQQHFFSHNDVKSLVRVLEKVRNARNILVVIDGIYSMHGDAAPASEIILAAHACGARVMIDESHSIGVVGPQGRGLQHHLNIKGMADITTASLGKAMGGIGGYVTGSRELISLLEMTSRPFVFSASLPPAVVAGLCKALEMLETKQEPLNALRENIIYFKRGLENIGAISPNDESISAIFRIIGHSSYHVMKYALQLIDHGVAVNPVFYPVVSKRKPMIRISVNAGLTHEMMDYALEVMYKCFHKKALL